MTYPTPTGAPPTATMLVSPTNQPESYYENLLRKDPKWGAKYADAYREYHNAHPGLTPYQNLMAYMAEIVQKGLDKVISETSVTLGKIPGAAAQGAEKAIASMPFVTNPLDFLRNIASFFDKLTEANTWLRVGEFLLGAALLMLGISKLFASTKLGREATRAVKSGVKVAATKGVVK